MLDLRVPSNYGHGARASAYEAKLAALPIQMGMAQAAYFIAQ